MRGEREAREKGKVDNNQAPSRIFAMLCPAICDPLNAEVRLYQRILNFVCDVFFPTTMTVYSTGVFLFYSLFIYLCYIFIYLCHRFFASMLFTNISFFLSPKRTTNYEKNIFRYSVLVFAFVSICLCKRNNRRKGFKRVK